MKKTTASHDKTGAKAFTLTLTEEGMKSLNYLCPAMGGLKKSQVVSYALTLLESKVRRETGNVEE